MGGHPVGRHDDFLPFFGEQIIDEKRAGIGPRRISAHEDEAWAQEVGLNGRKSQRGSLTA